MVTYIFPLYFKLEMFLRKLVTYFFFEKSYVSVSAKCVQLPVEASRGQKGETGARVTGGCKPAHPGAENQK